MSVRFPLFLALAVVGSFFATTRPAVAEAELINGVAVIVNDTVITRQEVELFIAQAADLLQRQYGNQPQIFRQKMAETYSDATEQLVARQLILHDFTNAGYNLPESIIDDTIRDRIRQRFGDRVTLNKTLKEQGMTYEAFRQRTREEIIVEALTQKNISQEVLISPQKIANYYEANKTNYALPDQIKLRMIVLSKPQNGDAENTKKLAEEILAKVKEGAGFADMARIHSEGSQRESGGDWGWVERTVLREDLAEIAFKLEKGRRSGVIDMTNSVYLMQVDDKRPAHTRPLNEVSDEIEKTLLVHERERLRKKWLDRLKTKSFVRYF